MDWLGDWRIAINAIWQARLGRFGLLRFRIKAESLLRRMITPWAEPGGRLVPCGGIRRCMRHRQLHNLRIEEMLLIDKALRRFQDRDLGLSISKSVS